MKEHYYQIYYWYGVITGMSFSALVWAVAMLLAYRSHEKHKQEIQQQLTRLDDIFKRRKQSTYVDPVTVDPMGLIKKHRRIYRVTYCSLHGLQCRDVCPVCNRTMKTMTLAHRVKE